jgi:hypothetical protein
MKKIKLKVLFSLLLLSSCNSVSSNEISENSSDSLLVESEEISSSASSSIEIEEKGTVDYLTNVEHVEKISISYEEQSFDTMVDIALDEPNNGVLISSASSSFYGNKEFVKATPNEGYHLGYLLKNNKYLSNSATTYFYTNLSNEISCHFASDDYYSVLFLEEDGTFISSIDIVKNGEVDMYNYPSIEGYDLTYSISLEELDCVTSDLIVIPSYLKQGTPVINATNCSFESKDYNYGDSITFTPAESSQLFQSFKVDGEIFSSSSSLTLTIYDDINIEAIYGTTFNIKSAMVSLNSTFKIVDNSLFFNCYSAPISGSVQVENGILLKDNIDDTYSESQVFFSEGLDELGNFKTSFSNELNYSKKYIQSYAVYREVVSDEYIYVVLVSDIYQLN